MAVLVSLAPTGGPASGAGRHEVILSQSVPEVVLGGPSGDARIRLPHGQISRRHCQLSFQETESGRRLVCMEDLGSRNGTRVNGVQLHAGERCPLSSGDEICLGRGEAACAWAVDLDAIVASGGGRAAPAGGGGGREELGGADDADPTVGGGAPEGRAKVQFRVRQGDPRVRVVGQAAAANSRGHAGEAAEPGAAEDTDAATATRRPERRQAAQLSQDDVDAVLASALSNLSLDHSRGSRAAVAAAPAGSGRAAAAGGGRGAPARKGAAATPPAEGRWALGHAAAASEGKEYVPAPHGAADAQTPPAPDALASGVAASVDHEEVPAPAAPQGSWHWVADEWSDWRSRERSWSSSRRDWEETSWDWRWRPDQWSAWEDQAEKPEASWDAPTVRPDDSAGSEWHWAQAKEAWREEEDERRPCAGALQAVLDTNQVLDLETLNGLLVLGTPRMIVPMVVVRELEALKKEPPDADAAARDRAQAARAAMRYLRSTRSPSLVLQCLADSAPRNVVQRRCNDDEVLACAVHYRSTAAVEGLTEVITEDVGLAVKCRAYSVPTESIGALYTRALKAAGCGSELPAAPLPS